MFVVVFNFNTPICVVEQFVRTVEVASIDWENDYIAIWYNVQQNLGGESRRPQSPFWDTKPGIIDIEKKER